MSETQEDRDRLLEMALEEPGVAEVAIYWERIRKAISQRPPAPARMVTSYATDANPGP